MARTRVRIDVIERDVKVLFPDPFSDEARSASLADTARRALKEAQQHNANTLGAVPRHETWVDGRKGASIDSVEPDGYVIFEFELLMDVFMWVAERLKELSPVGRDDDPRPGHPGLYRESHVFLADLVEADMNNPPDASEYSFVSSVPYARKIERGLSDQARSGVYQVVANEASKRFGNLARITFGYRSPEFGAINQWADTTTMASPFRRAAKREEWLRRQPAIVITTR